MDIDGPTAQGIAGPVAQDLHVPCQYDQVALRRCDQIQYATLLLGAGLRRDREMMERNVVAGGQLPEIGMIGDHPRHVHVQQPATLAEQQVVQAVAVLRHQDQHAAALCPCHGSPIPLRRRCRGASRPSRFFARMHGRARRNERACRTPRFHSRRTGALSSMLQPS